MAMKTGTDGTSRELSRKVDEVADDVIVIASGKYSAEVKRDFVRTKIVELIHWSMANWRAWG